MTLLDMVNEVLIRLREKEVTSVNQNTYSKLIVKFLNDTRRQVEDAYTWNGLSDTMTITTTPDVFSYKLTDAGIRFRTIDVLNDTSNFVMNYATTRDMNDWFLLADIPKASPLYYNYNGVDVDGDTQVDIYPVPNSAYTLRFNMILSRIWRWNSGTSAYELKAVDLAQDLDKILVPTEPVILGAYARAIVERGEDQGQQSSEAYQLFRSSLSDFIAIEANHYPEELIWVGE